MGHTTPPAKRRPGEERTADIGHPHRDAARSRRAASATADGQRATDAIMGLPKQDRQWTSETVR